MNNPEPVAFLLRDSSNKARVISGEAFVRRASADSAAERKSTSWRKVSVVPVYAEPVAGEELPPSWTCFFCDETFGDRAAAKLHFGADEDCTPACRIKASEGGLIKALRDTEEHLYKAHCALHDDSAEALRQWHAVGSRHEAALRSVEETGYERGMNDTRRSIETLRRALAWHGELARMATTREEWQQEIDEAIRWVKDNPEEGRPSFPSWSGSPD